ncbi:dihydrolipoamide acetyltransferase family protein [Dactylosporangium sp. NPDC051484]|uniref:dihydrolipoamide acetyltransferase family protein n=1 Tax=Dactylosporangium sp. NPDC051484 TaxID=3154942 RepID=UPI00344C7582
MRYEFTLPDLGEGLTEAEIVRWLVEIGDRVTADQEIVEVETAKAMVEIPSPVSGFVRELGGAPGDTVPVGSVLIALEVDDTSTEAGAPHRAADTQPARRSPAAPPPPARVPADDRQPPRPSGGANATFVLASPSTRKHAVAMGVDLSAVAGTGPAGRVTREDVDRAAAGTRPTETRPVGPSTHPTLVSSASSKSERGRDRVEPLRGVRRQIARSMTEAWQTVPHITEFREIDATELVVAHRTLRASAPAEGPKFTFLPLLAMACVRALRSHPVLNASIDCQENTITYHARVNLGIATASSGGLVVPVLQDADLLDVFEISAGVAQLADAVRDHRVRLDQLGGGTFTISNFGSYGTWLGTPIIKPPEVAIAGFGRIRDAVVAVDGRPEVRPTLPIAVSADHRLIDGNVLGAFVNDLAAALVNPYLLIGRSS